MYMHEHQYMCIATFDKDTFIKHYAPTKQQAYELVLSEIKECPFWNQYEYELHTLAEL